MTAQIYLIAPNDADAAAFADLLARVLDAAPVAALLLPAGNLAPEIYETLVRAAVPVAQARDCAVLIDNAPERVRELGADGVHMSGGLKSVKAAIAELRPDAIVGAGDVHSRHDAMLKGEAGVDYLMFGNLDGTSDQEAREMADWWSETVEIPVVYAPAAGEAATIDPGNLEFLALGADIWTAPEGPDAALSAIAARLGVK